MTGDDIEHDLRHLLGSRALDIDEHAVTGETVRRHLDRRRRTVVWAPLATAAAVVALVAGVTVAVATDTDTHPTPATSNGPTTVTTTPDPDGYPPPCPLVTSLPSGVDTVCLIGEPPSIPPGSVLIVTPGRP